MLGKAGGKLGVGGSSKPTVPRGYDKTWETDTEVEKQTAGTAISRGNHTRVVPKETYNEHSFVVKDQTKHVFHRDGWRCPQVGFHVVQATSPPRAAASRVPAPRTEGLGHRHGRSLRRATGIAIASCAVLALVVGGAVTSSAAQAQSERLAVSSATVLQSPASAGTADGQPPQQAENSTAPIDSRRAQTTSTAEWTAMFGGDSLLTRLTRPVGVNPFDRQDPLMRSADLAVVNVETAISDSNFKEPKQYNFKSPVNFAAKMAEAGIDVGSLANNHSMDFGDQGMIDTVDALKDAGVVPVGAGVNRDAALTPSFHSIKGVRVAVIGASQIIPHPSWIATNNTIGVAAAGKDVNDEITKSLTVAIATARAQADVVIVFMHWGVEKQVCPTELQQRTAAALHAAGASVVVGAHPHVLQPLVRTSEDVTAYSLGNFIWDPRGGITADTGILELRFRGAAIDKVVFHPHRLDGNGWAVPAPDPLNSNRILGQIERHCAGADGTGSLDRLGPGTNAGTN